MPFLLLMSPVGVPKPTPSARVGSQIGRRQLIARVAAFSGVYGSATFGALATMAQAKLGATVLVKDVFDAKGDTRFGVGTVSNETLATCTAESGSAGFFTPSDIGKKLLVHDGATSTAHTITGVSTAGNSSATVSPALSGERVNRHLVCGTDDGPAIQAAIDAVTALGGGEAYVGKGVYLVGQELFLPYGVTLKGEVEPGLYESYAWDISEYVDGSRCSNLVAMPGIRSLVRPQSDPVSKYNGIPFKGYGIESMVLDAHQNASHCIYYKCDEHGQIDRRFCLRDVCGVGAKYTGFIASLVNGIRIDGNTTFASCGGHVVWDGGTRNGNGFGVEFSYGVSDFDILGLEVRLNRSGGIDMGDGCWQGKCAFGKYQDNYGPGINIRDRCDVQIIAVFFQHNCREAIRIDGSRAKVVVLGGKSEWNGFQSIGSNGALIGPSGGADFCHVRATGNSYLKLTGFSFKTRQNSQGMPLDKDYFMRADSEARIVPVDCVYDNTPLGGIFTGDGTGKIGEEESAASGVSFIPDGAVGSTFNYILTGEATINSPKNLIVGKVYTFVLVQDLTGGRMLTWSAAYVFHTPFSATGNTANKVSVVQFVATSATIMRQAAAQQGYAT